MILTLSFDFVYAFSKSLPAQHLCGFFCAKEAYIKASGKRKVDLRKIEVVHDDSGAPLLLIHVEAEVDGANLMEISLSISHTREYANAVVIIV